MLTGCVDEFEAELPSEDTRILVVEGRIRSDHDVDFLLSWSTPLYSDLGTHYHWDRDTHSSYQYTDVDYVSGAKVKVCGTDGSEYVCKEYNLSYGGSGRYTCKLPKLKRDVAYYLYIKLGDDVYQSVPEKPVPTPEIEDFSCIQRDPESDIDVMVSTAAPEDPNQVNYFLWDYSDTWEIRPRLYSYVYFDIYNLECVFKSIYPQRGWKFGENKDILVESTVHYDGGKLAKHKLYSIPRTDERIFWYYHSSLIQQAISKAEYEYHLAVRQAGWEMGGLFTPQPSTLPGNIRCMTSDKRTIGYVGCSWNTATCNLLLDCSTISREIKKPNEVKVETNPEMAQCLDMVKLQHKLVYMWDDKRDYGDKLTVYWADDVDIDIRLEGASTKKPPYMPPFDE